MEVYISESAQDDPQERWVMLKQPDVSKICEAMIQVMESGLPPEARTMDAFDLILKECREKVHRKRVSFIPDEDRGDAGMASVQQGISGKKREDMMGDRKEESRATREGINEALKEEFYGIHSRMMELLPREYNAETIHSLIKSQISLAQQIIREERALSGENGYALPPYRGV